MMTISPSIRTTPIETAVLPSDRVLRTHLPKREATPGVSVRDADVSLRLDGGGNGLLDTTHFDTVRFPPPPWILGEMKTAIENGSWAYTPYRGAPEVLESIAGPITDFLGSPVTAANLALTPGTQGAIFTTLSALINEGDLVLLADPDYLFCERILEFLGARIERIPLLFDTDEPTLDLDLIERLSEQKPKLLMFSHPNNPTGSVFSEAMIARVAELAIAGDFLVMADELYSRLVYGSTPFHHLRTQPGMAERSITLLGPSKTESMSGFRIGVIVAPNSVIQTVEQCLAMTSLRAPAYSQRLLGRWLADDADFLAQRISDLEALRDTSVARLGAVPGLHMHPQNGTAYLFVDVSAFGATDVEIADALQREARVIVSPGYQFGAQGSGHFRICYARDEAEWDAALDLMVTCLTGFATRAGITA
jgi:aspartate/methionine/tyrosine aminotransferase